MQVKNLPQITARYWTAILAASMAGANMGDFFSYNLHLGHTRGLLPLAGLFALILWTERRSRGTTETYYWLAIIVLRTAATNLADLATHDLRLDYGIIDGGLTALLVVILLAEGAWGRSPVAGNPANGVGLPATDGPYWAAMLTAGTLGTATGDFVADKLGLGLGVGSLLLAAIFALVLLLSRRLGASKPWYWASIVAARTAGTTMGDFVANQHGISLGLPLSTAFTCSLLAGIVILWPGRGVVAVGEA